MYLSLETSVIYAHASYGKALCGASINKASRHCHLSLRGVIRNHYIKVYLNHTMASLLFGSALLGSYVRMHHPRYGM